MTKSKLGAPVRTGRSQVFTADDRRQSKNMGKPRGKTTTPTPTPLCGGVGWGVPHQAAEEKQTSAEQLLTLARTLPKPEQRKLLAALAAEQTETGKDRDQQAWIDALLAALLKANRGQAGGLPTSFHLKRAMASGGWSAIAEFMHDSGFMQFTVNERAAAYRLLATLLLEHATEVSRRKNVPKTPQLLASCATNIGALFENAFPGYLSAGIARVVVRTMIQGQP